MWAYESENDEDEDDEDDDDELESSSGSSVANPYLKLPKTYSDDDLSANFEKNQLRKESFKLNAKMHDLSPRFANGGDHSLQIQKTNINSRCCFWFYPFGRISNNLKE